jgi:hypothetical protein
MDKVYAGSMVIFRMFTVAVMCLSLGLPLAVWLPCCCGAAENASVTCCVASASTPKCCHTSEGTAADSCSTTTCHQCLSSCSCALKLAPVSVFPTQDKSYDVLVLVYESSALSGLAFFGLLSSIGSSRVPIPIGHNRRLATLCVWRK